MELRIIDLTIRNKVMIRIRYFVFLILSIALVSLPVHAQSLKDLLDEETPIKKLSVEALFKSTRIVNGHSAKQLKERDLDYRISHRFGSVNSGAYEMFGLDHSSMHMAMEYGISDRMMVGLGRGTLGKIVDGFVMYALTNQETGPGAFPLTIKLMSSMEVNTLRWADPDRANYFRSRLSYAHQLLVARKFDRLTLQLAPTLVHRNLVPAERDHNDLWAMGIGGRFKLTNRLALTGEYYYIFRPMPLPGETRYYNPLSLGFDIETGGHVFQIVLTNSQGMREGTFIGNTTGSWLKGGVHLGFNISRVFSIKK
ncbi:MAG TPA: hypothetical protein DC042_11205 [Bacteroidales bacterium]|nr:hypothetical protein [Bacteroidales bacterium]